MKRFRREQFYALFGMLAFVDGSHSGQPAYDGSALRDAKGRMDAVCRA